jgi:hypothetical protein
VTKRLTPRPIWQALADEQEGVVSRRQLLDLGLTPAQAHQNMENGRWRRLLPGVFATFTGPVGPLAEVWAAVLYAGAGAAASHGTALWLANLLDELPRPINISVGHRRRVRNQRGLRIHRVKALDDRPDSVVHPAAQPLRVRVEVAVLDQAETSSAAVAVDLVLRATQRRLTTAARVSDALAERRRHRFRALLLEVLADAAQGVASPLERHYLRSVERAHRLPRGGRNQLERAATGGSRYRDVRYPKWKTIVELDGREAHPDDGAFRDLRRDNEAVVAADWTLRYGWRDVVGRPCEVAVQVGMVLQGRGWPGQAKACGAECVIGRMDREVR